MGDAPTECIEAQLVEYYDNEGDHRATAPIDPPRLEARQRFVAQLTSEGRASVLEIGSGPGRDASGFRDGGFDYVAVDLSMEHARRCRATGASVARATARQLPFRTGAFDAVWSMSTLMHVPDAAIGATLDEVARVLRPDGLAAIGVWGGPDVTEHTAPQPERGLPERFFARRSEERWCSMLGRIGEVESSDTWSDRELDFFYHLCVVRARGR